MDYIIKMCWKCRKNTDKSGKIFRTSECPLCGTDLHSCRNCAFYDKKAHYQCHETIDELISDKDKRNFCESFSEKQYNVKNKIDNTPDKAAQAREAFNKLFGAN